jgi:hypothetical protein
VSQSFPSVFPLLSVGTMATCEGCYHLTGAMLNLAAEAADRARIRHSTKPARPIAAMSRFVPSASWKRSLTKNDLWYFRLHYVPQGILYELTLKSWIHYSNAQSEWKQFNLLVKEQRNVCFSSCLWWKIYPQVEWFFIHELLLEWSGEMFGALLNWERNKNSHIDIRLIN